MKKLLIIATILLILASTILGCNSASTTTPKTATPTATTAAVKKGGTFTFILWMSPKTPGGLPWELFGGEFITVSSMFDPLLNSTGKGVITGRLAESYKVADDNKSITFNLRKGVKFIDGSDFNAKVAKWNMDKTIATKQYPYWGSVDVVDDYTIKVNLTSWVNTIISSFTSQGTWMISQAAYEKNGEEWARNNPTGTGPFKFASFEKDVNYKVVKNAGYWDPGKPVLDGVTVLYISDANTIRMAMESGQADACQIEAGKTAVDLKAKGYGLQITIGTVMCMIPDTAHADSILANKKVREAIEYAIDRESIAKAFSYGLWAAPYQIPPASSMGFNPNFTLARKYDPAKAKALLSEAGYPNGIKVTLGWPPLSLDMNVALAVQADLAKVGIELKIDAVPVLTQFFDNTNKAHDTLFVMPVFSGANWNAALSMTFAPSQKMMNMAWGRTDKFIELYNKSMASKAPDAQLMWDVSNYLTSEAEVIPVICGASAYCTASYVMDGGWYMTTADYNPATLWLNK